MKTTPNNILFFQNVELWKQQRYIYIKNDDFPGVKEKEREKKRERKREREREGVANKTF